MTSFQKGNFSKDNFDLYKNNLNENFNKTLLYDFYINYFESRYDNKKKLIQMHPLIIKNTFRLSNEFILGKNSQKDIKINEKDLKNSDLNIEFDTIFYKGLFPLDTSEKNFLYLKLLKFHLGMMKFFDLYSKYNFEKLYIDEVLMNDFLNKKFLVCLNNKKSELKNKAEEYNDFQLISNICVKERLTLYNFLSQEMQLKNYEIKRYINNQYINVFRKNSNRDLNDLRQVKEFDFSKEINKIKVEDIIDAYRK